jgi:RNA polymerase sigma factor (sigma-70 family)
MLRGESHAVPKSLRFLLETGSMAGMTDGQLVERFAAGRDSAGEAAFAVLVSRHGPMVLGTCRSVLGDRHTADDAFQAVFLVLARRAGSIREPNLLAPWLHGVATRIARKARAQADRRRRRENTEVEMNNFESVCREADARALRDEDAAAVHAEVAGLPERYRRAVVLCHFEGLSHSEAARLLGCAPGTVGSLVSRARDLLRIRLTRRGLSAGAVALIAVLEPKLVSAAVPLSLEQATIQAAVSFATNRAATAAVVSTPAVDLARRALTTMTLNKLVLAGTLPVAMGVAVAAGGYAAGMPRAVETRSQRPTVQENARNESARTPLPGLPGAVSQPPPWLGNAAPFDVVAFFAAPPLEENAAPRYLEALFEFGPEVEMCFPEGSDRESRKRAVEQRLGRFWPLFQSWIKDPTSVSAASIDALVSEFDTGFRKLDWAQQRPRCVFETGLGATARIPHVQTVGHVGRVARLKVHRELERGEFDAAFRDLSRLLRLSRDLLPRGVMITGMVSAATDRVAVENVIVPMLNAKGLTAQHCDRILGLLIEHEARSSDPYVLGLRADYVSTRATLHGLVFDQKALRESWDSLGNRAGPSIVAAIAEPVVTGVLRAGAVVPRPAVVQPKAAPAQPIMPLENIPDLDARIARTTPDELAVQVEKLNEFYRGLLEVATAPDLERVRKSTERPPSLDTADLHTRVTRGLMSAFTAFTQALARSKARTRVAEGVVAVRRWQLAHGGETPPSLDAATKEAGLPSLPVDPYDRRPIRFAIVGGQPTVYSVGQDGRDDGGRIDNARTPDSGDLVLRLPVR